MPLLLGSGCGSPLCLPRSKCRREADAVESKLEAAVIRFATWTPVERE